MPLIKKSHTLQPGAQNPQPGPFPTGPYNQVTHDFLLYSKKELNDIVTQVTVYDKALTVLKR